MLLPRQSIVAIVLRVNHGTQLRVGWVVASTLGWDPGGSSGRRAR